MDPLDRFETAAAGVYDRFVKHGDARSSSDCWTVNVGDGGVLIRRGGPRHNAAKRRPVALTLSPEDALALAHAILEGVAVEAPSSHGK